MKTIFKTADLVIQALLIVITIISLFTGFVFINWEIPPAILLGGWQVMSNVLNYLFGREDITHKGRRAYTKALLIDIVLWAPFTLGTNYLGGYALMLAFAQLPFSAIMAFFYLFITHKEVMELYVSKHENINHRWLNL